MKPSLIVSGISTGVGKTFVSAILTHAFCAAYYKPIQSGSPTDRAWIEKILPHAQTFSEFYLLQKPISPHAAAAAENKKIDLQNMRLPNFSPLIVELAGGILVPLDDTQTNLDLIKKWKLPVVLVSNFYLGSINHTLLSLQVLEKNNIEIYALVFNGEKNNTTVEAIKNHFLNKHPAVKTFFVSHIPDDKIDTQAVLNLADELRRQWNLF